MDFVERMAGSFGGARFQGMTPQTFMKLTDLDPRVQRHLTKVYATLACALVVSAVGCYMDLALSISGILTYLAGFACLVGLGMTASTPESLNKRYAMLAGFSFAQGASLGPLVRAALSISPGIVLVACCATATVFACFSAAALLTKRRSYLYLGGYLSSALSAFMVMRLVGWFTGGSAMVHSAELYVGLLVFAGYIIFDTQMIVEKCYSGMTDHVKHALDLLVDVLAVFVRILIILLKSAEKKERQEQDKRKRQQ